MLTIPNTEFHQAFYSDTFKLIRDVSSISLHTPNGKDYPKVREALLEALNEMHEGWDKTDRKVIYSGKMPDVAAWFDQDKVFPLKKITFEGLAFPVPHDPDHYLGSIYSFNFMELPPEDKRTIHAHEIKLK
jgi:lipopolysaccharide cholinephosphotransferase